MDSGAKLQLLAVGPQDVYLTSMNGPSHWNTRFRRPTRFALELVQHPFPNGFLLGKTNKTDIPLAGDCLGTVALEIRLPRIPGADLRDTWVPKIGYVLLRRIKVFLNETLLSDQERLWYDLHDRLFLKSPHLQGVHELVGHEPLTLTKDHTLLVPLKMPWNLRRFFPTVAMPGVAMSMEIETETFDKCISMVPRTSATTGTIAAATFISPTLVRIGVLEAAATTPVVLLLADNGEVRYTLLVPPGAWEVTQELAHPWEVVHAVCGETNRRILAPTLAFPSQRQEVHVSSLFEVAFLDTEERHAFLRDPVYWSFETVVDMEAKTYRESLSTDGQIARVGVPSVKVDLSEVNMPVRGLVWVVYLENYDQAYFTYEPHALDTCQVCANNQQLLTRMPAAYFQLFTRFVRGSVGAHGRDGVHLASFCMDLGNPQPSGALGFDKAKQPYLDVTFTEAYTRQNPMGVVKVFAVVRRLLQLHKGGAAFVTV